MILFFYKHILAGGLKIPMKSQSGSQVTALVWECSELWFSFCHISLNKYLFAKHPQRDKLFESLRQATTVTMTQRMAFLKGLAYSLCGNEVHCCINEEKGERLLCLRTLSAPCRGQQDYLLYHGEHSTNSKTFYALYLFSTEVLRPGLRKKQDTSPDGPVVC